MSGLLLTACTAEFEAFNTNPNEVTDEEMTYDMLNIGAYFTQMQRGVFIVGTDLSAEYQITEMLSADLFASYFAVSTSWGYTTYNHDHYYLYYPWYDAGFNDAYTDIMQPWRTICEQTDESSVGRAMATVVKVIGMSRITDMYGPIPYSQFGTGIQVAYDSQKDIYYQFFDELEEAIDVLTSYADSGSGSYMSTYDYIYSGDVSKWVKFANTLRLRLAMRLSNVDESKAIEEAEAAINHSHGLMTSTSDSAYLHQGNAFSFKNPIWEVMESWRDLSMSANMDCYLNGYNDPRISAYFAPAVNDGQYHGMQNGLTSDQAAHQSYVSSTAFDQSADMQWMDVAEAYFLLAEAKLRFGLGSETAQSYYEQGITMSFSSRGVSGADSYLNNTTARPNSTYTDPYNTRYNRTDGGTYLSNVQIAWDETADQEGNLEQIMVQKWIAIFPDGQEAWSDMRRTGYPGIFPIYSNQSGGEVPTGELISRLKFPSTEYSNNSSNVQEAVTLLGGSDSAGTRLWWDVNR